MKNKEFKIITFILFTWCQCIAATFEDRRLKELQLINVAWLGNVEKFKSLLEEGVDINATNDSQHNAWTAACYSGRLPIVKYLYENKRFNINYRFDMSNDDDSLAGATGVLLAIQQAQYDVARYLIDQGADLQIKNKKEEDPVIILVRRVIGAIDHAYSLAQYLIKESPNPTILDEHNKLLLRTVIYQGDLNLVKYLVETTQVDINAPISLTLPVIMRTKGIIYLPLLTALKRAHNQVGKEILNYFLQMKPDLTRKNHKGEDGILTLLGKFSWPMINLVWKKLIAFNNMQSIHYQLYLRKAVASNQSLDTIKNIVDEYSIDLNEDFLPSTRYPGADHNDFLKKMSGPFIYLVLNRRKWKNSSQNNANHQLFQYFIEAGNSLDEVVNNHENDVITATILEKHWGALHYLLNSAVDGEKIQTNHFKLLVRVAVRYCRLDLLKRIINEKKANIDDDVEHNTGNNLESYREHPLFLALQFSHNEDSDDEQNRENEMIRYLLTQIDDLNIKSKKGVSFIIELLKKEKWGIIQSIIHNPQHQGSISGEDYKVILRAAIYDTNQPIVKYLVGTKHIPINEPINDHTKSTIPNKWHDQPLLIALEQYSPMNDELLSYLKSSGAELLLTNLDDHSVLIVAVRKCHNIILNNILKLNVALHPTYKQVILNYATRHIKYDMVKKVVEKDVDLNHDLDTSNFTGDDLQALAGTPLSQAVRTRALNMVTLILEKGGTFGHNNLNKNPLLMASGEYGSNHDRIVRKLVAYKDQLHLTQSDIDRALEEARSYDRGSIVTYLEGVNLDERNIPLPNQNTDSATVTSTESNEEPGNQEVNSNNSSREENQAATHKNDAAFIAIIVALCFGMAIAIVSGYSYFFGQKKMQVPSYRYQVDR